MFSSSSLVSLSSLALMMCFTNVISFSVPPRTFVVSRGFNQPLYMAQGEEGGEKKGFFANFFEELDNFIDDATSRRLGAGQAFYGKRKSSFYGADDTGKKRDNSKFDPTGTCFLKNISWNHNRYNMFLLFS